MSDFKDILTAYEQADGDPEVLRTPGVARLIVDGNRVVASHDLPGLHMTSEELPDGVRIRAEVASGVKLPLPVHLCFGVLPEEGVQRIYVHFEIGAWAQARFMAHCTFPNAREVEHIMEGTIHVGEGARMEYRETHFHGPDGGVDVLPTARVTVDEGGYYSSTFALHNGRAGHVAFDYEVDVAADGVAELYARLMGSGDDDIFVREVVRLNGARARGLAKSRIAVRERASSDVHATTEGHAPGARGHVDCVEIVRDQAIANAVPVVRVTHPQAQVTHEAAIGTVDKKQLETLLARGLEEDAAVDVIVRGMLAD
ncbi:MAG: SufB/SufD family protein [Anaerolineae bacterium]